jgi:hypothetical protein
MLQYSVVVRFLLYTFRVHPSMMLLDQIKTLRGLKIDKDKDVLTV